MARTSPKAKGRKERGSFAGIPKVVMRHPDYIALSPNAKNLLLEFAFQFNGYNNGNLNAAWSNLNKRGWKSKTTLSKALKELLASNFIILTRTGYFQNPGKRCALYALTWRPINECPGKDLEVKSTEKAHRQFAPALQKKPCPESGPTRSKNCTDKAPG